MCQDLKVESERLLACLDADFRRLRNVAADSDLSAPVPSCPGWSLADLVRHVAVVYLHKAECIGEGRAPQPWPPEGIDLEPPLGLLDRSYGRLTAEFAVRTPEQHAFSWYEPDQSVGFWIRRMAQETVIHRVDAEQAARVPVAAIPVDLAADGIAEVLVAFLQYGTTGWPEDFAELLSSAGDRTVELCTPQRSWRLRLTKASVVVDDGGEDHPSSTVTGPAPEVLLWLWGRDGPRLDISGDAEAVELLRRVLVGCTQ
jgi:uncharacterized protein (TIGR03083 family)